MSPEAIQFIEVLHESLDSTNEEAKRLVNAGHAEKPVIIRALTQTAGKGTQGRRWISPAGVGLYFSIVHPFIGLKDSAQAIPLTPLFTIAAGVACAQAIEELTQLKIQLKPINDLYIEGQKLGGILVESIISNGQCRAVITGIGINILRHEEVQAGCEQDARGNQPTSLQACVPPLVFSQWTVEQIAQELMMQIAQNVQQAYQQLLNGQPAEILENYAAYKLADYPMPPELEALNTNPSQ